MYELVLTRKAQKFYEHVDDVLAERFNRCFEQLQANPYNHPNIKRLRGSFAGCLRYRVGDWRVVYQVDEVQQTTTVLLIAHRSEVYR
jgi:mRNA interferase RelE/StbE